MLRIPAQFCCLLPLNLATMKSVPLPTWRTAALMFAPAPVARIACALPLLIMQQPVPGRASWCSGDNPTSAVSAVLLKPTYFPSPEGIFLAMLDERSKMRCQIFLMANDESKSFLRTGKDAKAVPRDCSALGEGNSDLTHVRRTFCLDFHFQLLTWKLSECPRVEISQVICGNPQIAFFWGPSFPGPGLISNSWL